MPILDPIRASVLATRLIASVDPALAAALNLKPHQASLALFTADSDDVGYVAADTATKKANVTVAYATSFYAGARHASGLYSGEFIGMLAADNPADAQAGLEAAQECVRSEAAFQKANTDGSVAFFAHLVSSVGSYFATQANVPLGSAIAYLIAPPLEATFGLDQALKAADVTLVKHFPPPSETNFSGGWLSGSQDACAAACAAFTQAVLAVAADPLANR